MCLSRRKRCCQRRLCANSLLTDEHQYRLEDLLPRDTPVKMGKKIILPLAKASGRIPLSSLPTQNADLTEPV